MQCFRVLFFSILFTLLTTPVLAEGDVHTWHTVSAKQGNWHAQLQMINQGGHFVTRDGGVLSRFEIDPNNPKEFGFIFDKGDNFDVAYSLTLTQSPSPSPSLLFFQSKTCVYVVTAKGPAQPDITPIAYHGAKCEWKVVKGVGEDYIVS